MTEAIESTAEELGTELVVHAQPPTTLCQCGCGMAGPASGRRFRPGHNRGPTRKGPDYVVDANGCWIWQHARTANGYGCVWDGERNVGAHRLYYERHVGPIPDGRPLDHLCRVRACVNPAHLEPVTPAENTRRGLNTRLTQADVDAIRASTEPWATLAGRYAVSYDHIKQIRGGRRWATK
jgi:hypothetical protein